MTDRAMLQFFECGHLPSNLRVVAERFYTLAWWQLMNLPENPERTAGLRKLLEAKDCAVRSVIYKEPAP